MNVFMVSTRQVFYATASARAACWLEVLSSAVRSISAGGSIASRCIIPSTHQRWLINAVRSFVRRRSSLPHLSGNISPVDGSVTGLTSCVRSARTKTSITRFAFRNLISRRRNRLLQIKARYRRHTSAERLNNSAHRSRRILDLQMNVRVCLMPLLFVFLFYVQSCSERSFLIQSNDIVTYNGT